MMANHGDLIFLLILNKIAGNKLDQLFLQRLSQSRNFKRVLRDTYLKNLCFGHTGSTCHVVQNCSGKS